MITVSFVLFNELAAMERPVACIDWGCVWNIKESTTNQSI